MRRGNLSKQCGMALQSWICFRNSDSCATTRMRFDLLLPAAGLLATEPHLGASKARKGNMIPPTVTRYLSVLSVVLIGPLFTARADDAKPVPAEFKNLQFR